ncbi:MAG: type II toxin-antitoxin system VapC family toxin [Sinomicrobium sp.]|nr:type II toxin-antitoxin system VapC family toxin [Sinomicrobium sp.]
MNYLLDTHTVLWFITDDKKLPEKTKGLIQDPDNVCFVSIASFWEIALKYALGKLELTVDLEEIFTIIEDSNLEIVPITGKHTLRSSKLVFHHRDPFDRLIIAQADHEKLTVITKDEQFLNYRIKTKWK